MGVRACRTPVGSRLAVFECVPGADLRAATASGKLGVDIPTQESKVGTTRRAPGSLGDRLLFVVEKFELARGGSVEAVHGKSSSAREATEAV